MNKRMREILATIENKRNIAKSYMDGETKDIEKAGAILNEVDELQKEFDIEKRLFEAEVTEIKDGTVEIMSIAREAGSRTKMAVRSNNPNVDAVGACVGMNGARVNSIVEELRGEKIDIIKYSEDTATFVSEALSPADVVSAVMLPDGKSCRVTVPDDQLSLAIGKEGQNARLAAKLTGCKIDIGSESAARQQAAEADDDLIADEEV